MGSKQAYCKHFMAKNVTIIYTVQSQYKSNMYFKMINTLLSLTSFVVDSEQNKINLHMKYFQYKPFVREFERHTVYAVILRFIHFV